MDSRIVIWGTAGVLIAIIAVVLWCLLKVSSDAEDELYD